MKHKLLLGVLVLICTQSFSQTRKGQWLAGGSSVFNYTETGISGSYRKQYISETSLAAGYFVFTNVAVELNMNINFMKNVDPAYSGYSY